MTEAISSKGKGKGGCVLVAFFLFFLGFGAIFPYIFFIRPALRIRAARDWVAVPCTVTSSEVGSHSDDDGTTYSIEISFRYEYGGRTHTSDRYQFADFSSSGRADKQAVVDGYPVGARATCFVNPADPSQAVIMRGWTSDLNFTWFTFLFPLIGLIGLIVLSAKAVRRRKLPIGRRPPLAAAVTRTGSQSASGLPASTPPPGPRVLKATSRPVGKFVGLLFFSAFWNGIVWFGVSREGLGLFLGIFVAIGLLVAALTLHQLLAVFNPTPTVRLSDGAVRLGQSVRCEWSFRGGAHHLRNLHLWLEGREEATYTRGTRTSTAKHTFAHVELAETTDLKRMMSGAADLAVPPGSMHSFQAKNNKVLWVLHLDGRIDWWPDVEFEYALAVLPAALSEPAAEAAGLTAEAPPAPISSPPPRSTALLLDAGGGRRDFQPGDELAGTAMWELDRHVRVIELRLFWYTSGRGTRDVQVVDTVRIDSPAPRGQYDFRFRLPDSPYSFAGKLIALNWAVELVADPGGQAERFEFSLIPADRPIVLPDDHAPSRVERFLADVLPPGVFPPPNSARQAKPS